MSADGYFFAAGFLAGAFFAAGFAAVLVAGFFAGAFFAAAGLAAVFFGVAVPVLTPASLATRES